MRFLLLSATPMYNSYKEIVWLLNLMNTNDKRGRIEVRDVFNKNGTMKRFPHLNHYSLSTVLQLKNKIQ
jgi:hypothetical protein